MKKFLVFLAVALLIPVGIVAQPGPPGSVSVNGATTVVGGGVSGNCLTITAAQKVGQAACGGSSTGTVTSVSVTSANGFTGSVATPTTTPAITLTTSINSPFLAGNGTALVGATIGTGVATALGINVGTAGAFVTNGGALGTPSSGTATNITGLPVAGLANVAANTWLGNFTGSSAAVAANAIPACTTGQALQYTAGTGFSCVTGTGTGTAVVFQNTPTLTTPVIGAATGTSLSLSSTMASAADTITSASATSLAVGPNGTTTPVFAVDSSTASAVAGLKVTGAATGGTVAMVTTDSGSNTNLTVNAKGTGTIGIGSVSTGVVTITPNTTVTGTLGSAAHTITSASATSLAVGPNGTTTPILAVDSSTGSAVAGLKVTGAATGGTVALVTTDSGSNTNLTLNAKGTGTMTIGGTSTGQVTVGGASTSAKLGGSTGTVVASGATITLAGVTTGTNADFLCMTAGGVITLQTSACTISSARFKRNIEALDTDSLHIIAGLQPVSFQMKEGPNADPNYPLMQFGLTAENVAAVDPRMAIYEDDLKTPKSYRQESVIAVLVGAVKELKASNDNLVAEVAALKRQIKVAP